VLLPHPYDIDPEAKELMNWWMDDYHYLDIERRTYTDWKAKHSKLFKCGALEVLPPPIKTDDVPGNVNDLLRAKLGIKSSFLARSHALEGRVAIAMHALFSNTTVPEFAFLSPSNTTTDHLRAALATQTLSVQFKKFPNHIAPEQIVELREKTAKFKEGFKAYLTSLVDDVEDRLPATDYDEQEAALRTYQRKIEPDLEEYLRRGFSREVSWWSQVVEHFSSGSESIVKIVGTPWDLGNYAKLAGDVAKLLRDAADRASERRSNKHLAYQFIAATRR
jgi:hypothetical protein